MDTRLTTSDKVFAVFLESKKYRLVECQWSIETNAQWTFSNVPDKELELYMKENRGHEVARIINALRTIEQNARSARIYAIPVMVRE